MARATFNGAEMENCNSGDKIEDAAPAAGEAGGELPPSTFSPSPPSYGESLLPYTVYCVYSIFYFFIHLPNFLNCRKKKYKV